MRKIWEHDEAWKGKLFLISFVRSRGRRAPERKRYRLGNGQQKGRVHFGLYLLLLLLLYINPICFYEITSQIRLGNSEFIRLG